VRMQVTISKHSAELAGACATTAQLKDCEGRLVNRMASLGQGLEERVSNAATLVTKAALHQGQGKFEALRDRVLGGVSDLQDQVGSHKWLYSIHRLWMDPDGGGAAAPTCLRGTSSWVAKYCQAIFRQSRATKLEWCRSQSCTRTRLTCQRCKRASARLKWPVPTEPHSLRSASSRSTR
jgi:hypothetical protein